MVNLVGNLMVNMLVNIMINLLVNMLVNLMSRCWMSMTACSSSLKWKSLHTLPVTWLPAASTPLTASSAAHALRPAQVAKMNGQPLGDEDRSREIRVEMARERRALLGVHRRGGARPRGDCEAGVTGRAW